MFWNSQRKLKELAKGAESVRSDLAELRSQLQRQSDPASKKPESGTTSSPLLPLVLGGVGTAILALVNNYSQWYSSHTLEEDKLRSTLILKAVEATTALERKKTLVFFVESGLISDPGDKIKNLPDETIPKVESSIGVKFPSATRIFASGLPQLQFLNKIFSKLSSAGIAADPPRILNDDTRPTKTNEIRYFHREDQQEALRIAGLVRDVLGVELPDVKFFEDDRALPQYIEIWIARIP